MMKGSKVKVINRKPPKNKEVGEVIHAFKDHKGSWLSTIEYPDGERFIAIEGIDILKPIRSMKFLRKLEVD